MSANPENSRAKLDGAVAGGLAWTAGAKSATQVFSWLSAVVAARLLTKEDFGLVNMAGSFANLTLVLAEFGLGTAALQMPELDRDVIAQLNTCALAICAAAYGLAALCAPLVAMFFRSSQLTMLVIVNSLGLLITGLQSVPNGLLQKELDYRRLSMAESAQAVTMAAVTIASAAAGYAYWSLVAGALSGRLVSLLLTVWWMPVGFRWPRWKQVEHALRMGLHVGVNRLAFSAYALSDGVIVGRMLGPSAFGVYGWAMNIASAPTDKIGLLVMRVTGPVFARVQKDQEMVRRYFRLVSEGLSLAVFPMMLGLVLVAPEVVRILGPQWADAAGPVRWLAIFVGARLLSTLVTQVLTSLRFTRFTMWISVLSFLVMPAAFLLATRWGITAVAASWILLTPVTILPLVVKLFRAIHVGVWDYLNVLVPAAVGSAAMIAVVFVLRLWLAEKVMPSGVKLLLEVAAGGVVYAAILFGLYRDRLNRYIHFVMAARRGNTALAESDLASETT